MRSAMTALAWKEWREQRPIVLAAILLALLTPWFLLAVTAGSRRGLDVRAVADILPAVLYLLVCPVFAAAAGSSTIANEIGDGTLGFLLSRPMPRTRIWGVKVAVGAAASALIFLGAFLVAWLFTRVAGIGGGSSSSAGFLGIDLPGVVMLAGIGAPLLLYCVCVFFSTFFSRAMNAAVAGLAASLAILGAIVLVWSRLDLLPRLEPGLFALELLLAAGASLAASLYIFCRGELLGGRGAWTRGLLAGLAGLAVLAIVSVPAVWSQVRLSPDSAALISMETTPGGESLLVTATTPGGFSPEIWRIHTDGSGIERLTGRLTFLPAVSPDGRSIAYLSMRGAFGLRADRPELRVARADGSQDRAISSGFDWMWRPGGSGEIAFSPDGTRVALTDGGIFVIAPVDGGRVVQISLSKTPLQRGRIAGWSSDGGEVLVITPAWRDQEGTTLGAVDASTGGIRVIYHDGSSRAFTPFAMSRPGGWKRIPLFVDRDPEAPGGFELDLVDIGEGTIERIGNAVYGLAADLSADERILVHAARAGPSAGPHASELRFRDLAGGVDRVAGIIEGRAWSLMLSPSKDRVAVHRFDADRKAMPVAVVDLDGRVTALEPGWAPLGWQGRDRILLVEGEPPSRLAVADAATGALRVFYP